MNGWAFAAVACALAVGFVSPSRRDVALSRLSPRPAVRERAPLTRRLNQSRGARPRWARDGRVARRRGTALVDLCDALASELRAGATPRAAIQRAAQDEPLLRDLAVAARSPAGDVPSALRRLGRLPGGSGAGDLAAAWLVCDATGAGLATPAARLAAALRDEAQVRREVAAQLAGPKATAVLLAALPAVGLLMGVALGARPLHLLLGTAAGPALLVPGLLLELVGLLWTLQIARRAVPP
jgi:tight adherence protein B